MLSPPKGAKKKKLEKSGREKFPVRFLFQASHAPCPRPLLWRFGIICNLDSIPNGVRAQSSLSLERIDHRIESQLPGHGLPKSEFELTRVGVVRYENENKFISNTKSCGEGFREQIMGEAPRILGWTVRLGSGGGAVGVIADAS